MPQLSDSISGLRTTPLLIGLVAVALGTALPGTHAARLAVILLGTWHVIGTLIRHAAVHQPAAPEAQRPIPIRFSGTLGRSEAGVVEVLLKGGALRIRAIKPEAMTAAAGARVTVSVRPERIAVLSDGATMPNEIGATVRSVIYVGDHLRLVSDVSGIGPIVVKLPNGAGLPVLAPGGEVRLGWCTEDCLALDS